MLVGDLPKYAGVLFGIAVTTFLTTLVGSMFAGMLSRTYALIDDNPTADIWVTDPACETVTQLIHMPDTAIDRVRSVRGVDHASRISVGSASARLPHGRFLTVDVIGVDDASLAGLPFSVPADVASRLRGPDCVLADPAGTRGQLVIPAAAADTWSRGAPKLDAHTREPRDGDEIHVNDSAVRIRGMIAGSPRFNPQPTLYTTYSNASRILPPLRHRLTFVLASVAPGEDPARVARAIEAATSLRARTRSEFKHDTVLWFLTNAEFVSHVGVIVTFASMVGLAITALMLYMFTRENARYYATLMAIGATTRRMASMVIAQAAFAGFIGFGLGLGSCTLIGSALATTGFPFRIMPYTPAAVGALSLAITCLSALLSVRAILSVEPAAVFKSAG